jgi:anthranilate phosphoribosyltransferase
VHEVFEIVETLRALANAPKPVVVDDSEAKKALLEEEGRLKEMIDAQRAHLENLRRAMEAKMKIVEELERRLRAAQFAWQRKLDKFMGAYNAAAALMVAGVVENMPDGVEEAAEAIDKGLANALLNCWVAY